MCSRRVTQNQTGLVLGYKVRLIILSCRIRYFEDDLVTDKAICSDASQLNVYPKMTEHDPKSDIQLGKLLRAITFLSV